MNLAAFRRFREQVHSSVNYIAESGAVATAVVQMGKFSSLNKLISVTSLVFKFVNRLKKREMDSDLQANCYLLKTMQKESFPVELDFLIDPGGTSKPKLVRNVTLMKSRILFY